MLFKRTICGGISALLLSLILHPGVARAGEEMCNSGSYQIWGYYPYWMKDEWRKIDLGLFDRVLFFEVKVSAGWGENTGWPVKWKKLIVEAKKSGSRLQPTFTLFDANEFERIFSSPNRRRLLEINMLAVIDQADSSGLQLDFEIFSPVSHTSLEGFHSFLKSLKRELADRNRSLSLFVLAEDRAGLYDSISLMHPDYVVIQGYDAHWKESANAGPIAQIHGSMKDSWESSLKHYLFLGVPRNRILMSVPFYGYEWPTVSDAAGALTRGVGSEISFAPLPANLVPAVTTSAMARVVQFGARRDPETGSPYYVFKDGTGWVQGWFEDDESLSAKFKFIKEQRLAGVAAFPLGYDGGKFQQLLRRHFRSPNPCGAPSNSNGRHGYPAQGR